MGLSAAISLAAALSAVAGVGATMAVTMAAIMEVNAKAANVKASPRRAPTAENSGAIAPACLAAAAHETTMIRRSGSWDACGIAYLRASRTPCQLAAATWPAQAE